MLNWRLSLPSLRRCRSDKSDRDPKKRAPPGQDGNGAAVTRVLATRVEPYRVAMKSSRPIAKPIGAKAHHRGSRRHDAHFALPGDEVTGGARSLLACAL